MVSKKIADFGAADPFAARLGLGVVELAQHVLKAKGPDFDVKYEPVFNSLLVCRNVKRNTLGLIFEHKQKISLNQSETIDGPVKENVASFLVNGTMAVKGIQNVLALLDLDIGYLFQKQDQFYGGIDDLYASRRHFLASYLKQVRGFWSEKFISRRNTG